LAALKHGGCTKEAFKQYKEARELIRVSQDRLHSFGI